MIEKTISLQGVKDRKYDFVESESSSVFSFSDMPKEFGIGKNSFKIAINQGILVKGSTVLIDIIDSNGKSIYYEISHLVANTDRRIIVFIYPTTAAQECTMLFSGTVFRNPFNGNDLAYESSYVFRKKVRINLDGYSKSDIVFVEPPTISYRERIELVQPLSGTSRLVNTNGTGSISTIGSTMPYQLIDTNLSIEKSLTQETVFIKPTVIGNLIGTSKTDQLPTFHDASVITSKNFPFSASMKGGMIYVNNITVIYPNDAANSSIFSGLSYSASILEVNSTSSISVWPPFQKTFEYTNQSGQPRNYTSDRFFTHSDFTCSFYNYVQLTSSVLYTSQSFATMDITGVEPECGIVEKVVVSFKPVTAFGDFRPIGEFSINKTNLLTSTGSTFFDNELGVIEAPIGIFRNGLTDFQSYWVSQSIGTGSVQIVADTSRISNGIRIQTPISRSASDYNIIQPLDRYKVATSKNTEFELSLRTFSVNEIGQEANSQLDVYISGSDIILPPVVNSSKNLPFLPVRSGSLGTYIGSITSDKGSTNNNKFTFTTKNDGNISPAFVLRNGTWHVGDIKIEPRNESGYSPNQIRLQVPLDNVATNTELLLKVQYLNPEGVLSDHESVLSGVYFKGVSLQSNIFSTITLQSENAYYTSYILNAVKTFDNSGTGISYQTISFPIFKTLQGVTYTGSLHSVGMSFDVKTVIYGKTGSLSSTQDTYVWAGNLQGRAIVSNYDNSGQPLLFNVVAISGSNNPILGTFGSGSKTGKTNLDSWFTLNTVVANSGDLIVRYALTSTSSFVWDSYISSTCEVQKYEQQNAMILAFL